MRRPGAEMIATVVVCSAGEPQLDAICDRLIDHRYAPLPAGRLATLSVEGADR